MAHNKDKTSTALKKTTSLLHKIQKMIDNDRYCIDVIQQVLAAMGLLRSINELLLEGHLNHCYKNAIKTGNTKKQKIMIDELTKIMKIAQKK